MRARRSRSAIYDCIRLACGLLALHCPPAVAQSLSVTGRVSDTTGAPLPGVSVLLRTPDARQRAETVTDVSGKYRLDAGASRQYWVQAGFDPRALARAELACGSRGGRPARTAPNRSEA